MIRFDTFIFDYDTKNVIVFSCIIVLLRVRQVLLLTIWRLAKWRFFSSVIVAPFCLAHVRYVYFLSFFGGGGGGVLIDGT